MFDLYFFLQLILLIIFGFCVILNVFINFDFAVINYNSLNHDKCNYNFYHHIVHE